MTVIPNPSARCRTARPIRPRPTIPSVAVRSSRPRWPRGSQVRHEPSRARAAAVGRLRARARISASVRSAVASVSTPGVLPTAMPRAVAASTSMFSWPTAKFAIAHRSGAAAIRSASIRSVSRASSPSACRTPVRRSSPDGGRSPGQTSTSCSAARRSSALPGSLRVTNTRAMWAAIIAGLDSRVVMRPAWREPQRSSLALAAMVDARRLRAQHRGGRGQGRRQALPVGGRDPGWRGGLRPSDRAGAAGDRGPVRRAGAHA